MSEELQFAVHEDEIYKPQRIPKNIQIRVKKVLHKRNLNSALNFEKKKDKEDLPCCCHNAPWGSYPHLVGTLPAGFDYKVCHYTSIDDVPGSFEVMLRLPFLSIEKVLEWKRQLENKSLCLFRTCRTYTCTGKVNCFKKAYACQHNQSRGTGLHITIKTGCEAQMMITVRRPIENSQSDSHMPDLPTTIYMKWKHNHPRNNVLRARCSDVSEETRKEFVALFHEGHSPTSATLLYRAKLAHERGMSQKALSKDKRIWPEKIYVMRLFRKLRARQNKVTAGSAKVTAAPAPVTAATVAVKEIEEKIIAKTSETMYDGRCPVDVIIPAAGTSDRMGAKGASIPKQFQKVLGTPLIAYTIDCFHKISWIRHIILIMNPSHEEFASDLVKTYDWSKVKLCPGGRTRHRSIKLGVEALKDVCYEDSIVIIHDGARPFVPEATIGQVVQAAQVHGASGVVRPLVSTVIKPDKKNNLESTLIRSDYRNSEMPQAFQYEVISKAYRLSTDYDLDFGTECLLLALQHSNCHGQLVNGNPDLWKVTYPMDLLTMESVVREKLIRVSISVKTAQALPYLQNLKTCLGERQIKVCPDNNKIANTTICFLDLPDASTSPLLSNLYCGWIKHVTKYFKKLSWLEQRLGLYVVMVFVVPPEEDKPSGSSSSGSSSSSSQFPKVIIRPIDSDEDDDPMHVAVPHPLSTSPSKSTTYKEFRSFPMDTSPVIKESSPSPPPPPPSVSPPLPQPSSSTSALPPPSSSFIPPPPSSLSLDHQEHRLSPLSTHALPPLLQQQELLKQQKQLLQQQLKLLEQQQQLVERQLHLNPSSTQRTDVFHREDEPTPMDDQSPSPLNPPQQLVVVNNTNKPEIKKIQGKIICTPGNNKVIRFSRRKPACSQSLPKEQFQPAMTENNIDDAVEEDDFVHDSDYRPVGTISKIVHSKAQTVVEKRAITSKIIQPASTSTFAPQRIVEQKNRTVEPPQCSEEELKWTLSSPTGTLFPYIPVCQGYMRAVHNMLSNRSISDMCIVGILCQSGEDLTDKLVEMAWNRSRALDRQVLLVRSTSPDDTVNDG